MIVQCVGGSRQPCRIHCEVADLDRRKILHGVCRWLAKWPKEALRDKNRNVVGLKTKHPCYLIDRESSRRSPVQRHEVRLGVFHDEKIRTVDRRVNASVGGLEGVGSDGRFEVGLPHRRQTGASRAWVWSADLCSVEIPLEANIFADFAEPPLDFGVRRSL